ncbi:hypothetical protein [Oceaniradius stylonematis]|uniref:hypothetical protein n=1 Tax=Oceaniradius stylonematis TaxID=2184161 RepID=UPI003B5CF037
MDVLKAAQAHFSGLKPGAITVPEWGNAKLSWSPMTLAERAQIYAPLDNGEPASGSTIFVRVLVAKARTKDGKPAFSKMDENKLLHGVDPNVVARVARAILDHAGDTADNAGSTETAKNG